MTLKKLITSIDQVVLRILYWRIKWLKYMDYVFCITLDTDMEILTPDRLKFI
jgi:hypothetical protein